MSWKTIPIRSVASVTPDDATSLTEICRALYVGNTGDVRIETAEGEDVTFVNVQDGAILPVFIKKVFATSTTATNILALY